MIGRAAHLYDLNGPGLAGGAGFKIISATTPKVLFSTTLTQAEGKARLARGYVADEVTELTNQPGAGIVSVGGA